MSNSIMMIGHSLIGRTLPAMLNSLLDSLSADRQVDFQVINGAPLSYNWSHGASAEGVNAQAVLPSGDYSTLIMTEAIPLATHLQWSNTHGTAKDYANLALGANAATRVMIFETWHEITSVAAWRAQLTSDLGLWQGIADHLNSGAPASQPAATLVPAGQAMARLTDTILAGHGQGLTAITDLFSDNIHLTHAGNYFVSLVHMAALTQRSPVGLTSAVFSEYGVAFTGWTPAQARLFQHIAWEAYALSSGAGLPSGVAMPTLFEGTGLSEAQTGGKGDDRLYGGSGNDSLNGDDGHDLIAGGAGHDLVRGGRGNDWLEATSGNDTLNGGFGHDTLLGATGRDNLIGSGGNDVLSGGSGNDVLAGGEGDDSLTGGPGADRFVFAQNGGDDVIADFAGAGGDVLRLSTSLWGGSLSASQIVAQFAAVQGGDVVLTFASTQITLEDLTTTNGLASWISIF